MIYAMATKERILKTLFRLAVIVLVALQLLGPFLPFDSRLPLAAAALVILIVGFPLMSGGFRAAAAVFLLLALLILAFGVRDRTVWITALGSMTNIVAIVAVMQTFSVPIRLGGYDGAIRAFIARRFSRLPALFVFMTFVTHILTSFLNLGSIPVVVSLFREALEERVANHRRFLASALTRGYVLAALWTPGAVNLYLVVQATGLSWSRVFVPGLLLALAGMVLSILFEGRGGSLFEEGRGARSKEPAKMEGGGVPASRALHVLLVALAFVLLTLILEALEIGAASSRMVLAGAIVSALWTLTLARRPGIGGEIRGYWREGLLKTADIGPFFVAMGLFSGALEHSGAMDYAGPILSAAMGFLGGGSVVLVGLLIVAGSLVGLHPFITIVLFGRILSHADLPIPPLTLALGLSVGGAAAYMVTPFAGVIMTLSKLIGTRASDVALRWNWRFAILFFTTGMVFAFLWGAAFG
jgi:hypothetical protein